MIIQNKLCKNPFFKTELRKRENLQDEEFEKGKDNSNENTSKEDLEKINSSEKTADTDKFHKKAQEDKKNIQKAIDFKNTTNNTDMRLSSIYSAFAAGKMLSSSDLNYLRANADEKTYMQIAAAVIKRKSMTAKMKRDKKLAEVKKLKAKIRARKKNKNAKEKLKAQLREKAEKNSARKSYENTIRLAKSNALNMVSTAICQNVQLYKENLKQTGSSFEHSYGAGMQYFGAYLDVYG